MNIKNSKGIYFAFLTAVVSGISVFINKFAVGSITPPLVFTATKNVAVAILIIAFIIYSGKLSKFKNLKKEDITKLLLVGIIGGSIPFYLFFTGISQIPAINAALIHKTLVVWVALLAIPLLKEKLSKAQAVGIGLIFVSNLFVGGFQGFTYSKGELFVLLATLLWAVENIIAKKALKNVDPDVLVAARMGIGAVILVGASLIVAPASFGQILTLSTKEIFWLSVTVITLLGYVSTWYRALKIAPAITVSAVLVLGTLITNVLSAAFITHTWKLELVPQLLVLSVGLFIYIRAESNKVEVASIVNEN